MRRTEFTIPHSPTRRTRRCSESATTRTGTATTTCSRSRWKGRSTNARATSSTSGVLRTIVQREVIDRVDHRNLNVDVDFMRGINPTAENIVVACWRALEPTSRPAGSGACACGRRRTTTSSTRVPERLTGHDRRRHRRVARHRPARSRDARRRRRTRRDDRADRERHCEREAQALGGASHRGRAATVATA